VIRYDRSDPVFFEAKVSGAPTSVAFEYNGTDVAMWDDGSHGDRIALDSVYTITFQVSQVISKLTAADVYRPFIGYCKLYGGTTVVLQLNVFAEIWTESVPLVDVQQLDSAAQAAANLVNIVGQVSADNFDARPWSRRFYQFFNDDYDFLNIILMPSSPKNRYHFTVNNSVRGVGPPPRSEIDASGQYGSAGKLVGVSVFPIPGYFDGAEVGYQHELSHQWINFLSGTPFQSGIPHWPLSDVASGVIGLSIPGSNVGGQFPYRLVPEGNNYRLIFETDVPSFNDLELYLMGLLPADSVKPHFVFDNQNQTPQAGGLLLGPVTNISIDSLVSRIGKRVPAFDSSKKQFRIATIIISGSPLSAAEMSFYDFFAKRAGLKTTVPFSSGLLRGIAKPFYVSTGGRGELDPSLGARIVSVSERNSERPTLSALYQNYPNPFNPSTSIRFRILQRSHVTLTVYEVLGRELAKLVSGELDAGEYDVRWNPIALSSGVYFYRIQAGRFVDTKKLLLLR